MTQPSGVKIGGHMDLMEAKMEAHKCFTKMKKVVNDGSKISQPSGVKIGDLAMDLMKAKMEVHECTAQMKKTINDDSKMSQPSGVKISDHVDSYTNAVDLMKAKMEAHECAAQNKKIVKDGSKISQSRGSKTVDHIDSSSQSGLASQGGNGNRGMMNSSTKVIGCNIPKHSNLGATCVLGITSDARLGAAQQKKIANDGSKMTRPSGAKDVDHIDSCSHSGLVSKGGNGEKRMVNSSTKSREYNIPKNSSLAGTSVHGITSNAHLVVQVVKGQV